MISKQVREAIVRAFHDRKLSYEEIASLLAVGEATVSRVLRRHRETGSVAPSPRGGGNFSPLRGEVLEVLRALVREQPDATIDEITERLITRGLVQTSASSVGRALQRLAYSRKKSPSSRSSATRPSTAKDAKPSACS
jgi:transposase